MSNPKRVKYNSIWNPNLLINYYVNTPVPFDEEEKFKFIQKKAGLLLRFFFMLRPNETYHLRLPVAPLSLSSH
jgi:hypothetical protein